MSRKRLQPRTLRVRPGDICSLTMLTMRNVSPSVRVSTSGVFERHHFGTGPWSQFNNRETFGIVVACDHASAYVISANNVGWINVRDTVTPPRPRVKVLMYWNA